MDQVNDIPRRLGQRYEVGEVLGRGGMAEVHLSRDSRLGRLVAVKMLRSDLARDPVFQARFRREAHSAAALNHPSVVAVYDTGEDSFTDDAGSTARLPYIVMEYVEGQTAKELLTAADDGHGSGIGTERAVEITAGVLTALDYSHRQGIIHRDIKPANVMVTPDGAVKVMDFGIARALADTSATMTQTHAVIGTAQYLSPEQARGETVDTRTDLYSTGCLLYELLTGRPPFVGDSPVSVAYQHVREVPVPPSRLNRAISDALDRVVLKALAKDRDDRYSNAEEFRRDLLAAAGGRPVGAPAVGAAAAMATQALPSSAEATAALAAAGLGGSGLGEPTAATRRLAPSAAGERTSADHRGRAGVAAAPGERSVRTAPPDDDEPPRRRGALVGIVIALLVALGLLAAVLYNLLGGGAPEEPVPVRVPSVIGGDAPSARTAITGARLEYAQTDAANEAPAGTVVDQDPDAAVEVAPGSTVTVTVSTGPRTVAVPNVVGQREAQALGNLRDADLEDGTVTEEANAEVPAGQVIRTDPAADAQVPPGTPVNLFVSTGLVEVPDYAGLPLDQARQELLDLGLLPKVGYEPNGEVAENTVLRQDPPAGALEPGATVTLVVATVPAPTAEPTAEPTPTDGETEDDDQGEETPSPSGSGPSSPSSSSSATSTR